jgi:hypothetical protein
MAEEFVFAPAVDAHGITLRELARAFDDRGYPSQIYPDGPTMCWLEFERFKSRFVVSTSPDEKKDVGLITFEYVLADGDEIANVVADTLDALGFSNDPDAQYK